MSSNADRLRYERLVKLQQEERINRLNEEPDYVFGKIWHNSLEQLCARHPDGAPNEVIAEALQIPVEEVEKLYQQIVLKLRRQMKR